jgi:hypothetical protein
MRSLRAEFAALFGVIGRPVFIPGAWLALAVVALGVMALRLPHPLHVAALLFTLGAFFVAFNCGVAIPVALADVRGLRLPGRWPLLRYLGRALLLTLAVAVLIPAVSFALAEHSPAPVTLIVSAALTGLLIQRVPLPTVGIIWLVLILRNFIPGNVHFHRPLGTLVMLYPALGDPDTQLALALAGLAALVIWRWWRIVAGEPRALEAAARAGRATFGRYTEAEMLAGRTDFWFGVIVDTAHGGKPVRIVRTCLGPLYAPTQWTRRAARFALETGAVTVAFLGWGAWRLGWHWGWRAVVFLCLLCTWMSFGVRVLGAMQRVNGELAELAVLPGLGDRRAQLRALSQASLAAPLTIAGAVALAGAVCVAFENAPLAADGGSLLWILSTLLLGVTALNALLLGRKSVWPIWLVILCLLVALTAWMLIASSTAHPTRYLGVWALVPLVSVVVLFITARRLGALPHPFVIRAR